MAQNGYDKQDHILLAAIDGAEPEPKEIAVFFQRWIMLGLFASMTFSNGILWITFAPISDTMEDHYNVSNGWVNMLSLLFMFVYIVGIIPSTYCIDFYGLRVGLVAGAVLNTLGAWVRFAGGHTFGVLVLGQIIASCAQLFMLSVPPKLSATWFPEKERATATAIAALFNQIGIAVGFVLSPAIATSPGKIPDLLLVQAIITGASTVTVLVFFRAKPPVAPSHTAAATELMLSPRDGFFLLIKDKHFLLLATAFGMFIGGFYGISTVLNQVLGPEDVSEDETGWVGFANILTGIFGATLFGIALDRTKGKFYIINLVAYAGSLASVASFILAVAYGHIYSIFVTYSVAGFFLTGIMPACEMTYPVPEATSSAFLTTMAQVFGITSIYSMQAIMDDTRQSSLMALVFFIVMLSMGLVCAILVPNRLRRSAVEQEKLQATLEQNYDENKLAVPVVIQEA